MKFTPGDGAAGLVIHSDGGDKHYGFYPSNGGVRLSRFDGPDVYSWAVLREARPKSLKKEGWNSLKIRVESNRILCYLNGELTFETNDSNYKSGQVGLCKFRQTEAEFKGFRVGETVEQRASDELVSRISKVIEGIGTEDVANAAAVQALAIEDTRVVDLLEEEAKALDLRAARVRKVAMDVNAARTIAEFQKVVKAEKVDLIRGALLIAKLDNPELEMEGYIQEVERHVRQIKNVVAEEASEDVRLTALNRYLFEEQGFHGSRTDYDNRSNSYLNEVLDDREGLPITLSVLYIEIAKRLGLNVVGVGMPRHFLSRHEPKIGSPQLVDAFDRGRLLTAEDARAKFEELSDSPWKDSFLDSITPQATLERILRNLFGSASETHEVERMLRYTDAILVISPDSGPDHMYRGILSYQSERWQQARSEVEWLSNHDSNVSRADIEKLARAIASESQK